MQITWPVRYKQAAVFYVDRESGEIRKNLHKTSVCMYKK